jgi:hypothetical protein
VPRIQSHVPQIRLCCDSGVFARRLFRRQGHDENEQQDVDVEDVSRFLILILSLLLLMLPLLLFCP